MPARTSDKGARTRSAGVMMIGLGLALMILITFTGGSPRVGMGIGGAFAMLGAAFVVNAALSERDLRPQDYPHPSPSRPPDQP
jgi:hypothetical protein